MVRGALESVLTLMPKASCWIRRVAPVAAPLSSTLATLMPLALHMMLPRPLLGRLSLPNRRRPRRQAPRFFSLP